MIFIALIFTLVRTGSKTEKERLEKEQQKALGVNPIENNPQLDIGAEKQQKSIKEGLLKQSSRQEEVGAQKNESILKAPSAKTVQQQLQDLELHKAFQETLEAKRKKAKAMLNADAACNPNVLKAFGVHSPSYTEPQMADADELSFCRRNRNTCCSVADFNDVVEGFTENAKKLLRAFQPIEELLALFKGKNYQNYFGIIAGNERCQHLTKDYVDPEGKDKFYFYNKYTERKLDDIYFLLNDIEIFLKRQLWFHGNIMCSICNPNENPFYDLKAEGSTVKSLMNTCSDVMEGVEYQLRLGQLYNGYFKTILELIKCNDDPSATDKSEPIIPQIDEKKLEKLDTDFQTCLNKFDQDNLSCVAICSKPLSRFAPDIEFFTPYRTALSMIFSKFVEDGDITEYYNVTYQKEFPTADPTDITFFNVNSSEWKEYKLDAVTWQFGNSGVNIYNDQVSKKFLRVSTAAVY